MLHRCQELLVVLLVSLLLVPSLATVGAQEQTHETPPDDPTEGDWIVGFDVLPRDIAAGDPYLGGDVVRVDPHVQFIVVHTDDRDFADQARNEDDVVYVEKDRYLPMAALTPDDPRWSAQWGHRMIGADLVWNQGTGSEERVGCVIDSGLYSSHEEFQDGRYLGGHDYVGDDSSPGDGRGHGTFVAGIMGATMNNGRGIAGLAQSPYYAVRVLDSSGSGTLSDLASAVGWCDGRADVINMSLGCAGCDSSAVKTAIDNAAANGVLNVAASGNDGCNSDSCVFYPARYPNVIAVGAVDSNGGRASFSNSGPQLDLTAPGVNIISAWRGGTDRYESHQGTSAASPYVAGAALLLWSLHPHLSSQEVRHLLEDNAVAKSPTNHYGNGLVDVEAAFDAAIPEFPLDLLYQETFDDGAADGWSLGGLWHLDTTCSSPPTGPFYLGYHRSSACDYNILGGTQGGALFQVDLTDQLDAALSFQHRWETESSSSTTDRMTVQVRHSTSDPWTRVAYWDARHANQPGWTEHRVDLTTWTGAPLWVRFHFDTRDMFANSYDGWYLDDVQVLALDDYPPVADAGPAVETSDGDGDGVALAGLDGSASVDKYTEGGSVVAWDWFVGDELVASGAQPQVTLPVGTHTVRLVATDDGGASGEDTTTVTVLPDQPPLADAGAAVVANDGDGDGTETIILDGGASTDSDGTVVSWEWYVGEALVATGVQPEIALPVGEHTIRLVATDNGGASAEDTTMATILANQPPMAQAGPDRTVGDADGDGVAVVPVDGSASSDADGVVVDHAWYLGNETLGSGAQAELTLPVGEHTVRLVATDDGGATAEDSLLVDIVPNRPPVPDPGPDRTISDSDGDGFVVVPLDGTASHDPDGAVVSYQWETDGAIIANDATATTSLGLGTHTFVLTVTDEAAVAATASWNVTAVENRPPVAAFDVACLRLECTFDATLSEDDGAVVGWSWDFGDGNQTAGEAVAWTFGDEGTYTVCLRVADVVGLEDTACTAVTVTLHILSERFDDDRADGFALSGLWHVTDLCSTPPSAPLYLGYHRATVCDFDTGSRTRGSAEVPLDLTPWADPVLRFSHRYITETSTNIWDRKTVEVRPPGGPWQVLARYTDSSSTWREAGVDLSSFSGQVVDLRFNFDSGDGMSNTGIGWHIDDIIVTATEELTWPPVAAAGADLTAGDADADGNATVYLDGGGSSDADGGIVTYEWTLDGTVVLAAMAGNVTLPVGEHPITLTVTDDDGETDSDPITVSILPNAPPVADAGPDLQAADADGDGKETIILDGSASSDPEETLLVHTWRIGNSTVATGPTVTLALGVGDHLVELHVEDIGGAQATDTVAVTVAPNAPPQAVAGPDITLFDHDGTGAETTTLDASASEDADGLVVDFAWHSNGSLLSDQAKAAVPFAVGPHTVELMVHDDGGLADTDTLTVEVVPNAPPVAVAPADIEVNDDDQDGSETVRLDGSASHDDGGIVTFAWHTNGSLLMEGPVVDVVLPVGLHTVVLNVTDAAGRWSTAMLDVSITDNLPPIAMFTASCSAKTCAFDGTASSDPDGDTLTYRWSFGDGESFAGRASTEHVYADHGNYLVCLTVDDRMRDDTLCAPVTIFGTVYQEDFESGFFAEWTRSGLWAIGSACHHANSGQNMLRFSHSVHCTYQMPGRSVGDATVPIDLTNGTFATLEFQHWWQTEKNRNNGYDRLEVQTRATAADAWTTVMEWDSLDAEPSTWTNARVDLSAFAGTPIELRFRFDSGDLLWNLEKGWFIDDIVVVSDAPLGT